jgi:hypothetical protein
MYKILQDTDTGRTLCVIRNADNASIPFDLYNRDYQEYLEWLSQGNEPEPAEEASPSDENPG